MSGNETEMDRWEERVRRCDAAKYAPQAMERLIEQAKREQDPEDVGK